MVRCGVRSEPHRGSVRTLLERRESEARGRRIKIVGRQLNPTGSLLRAIARTVNALAQGYEGHGRVCDPGVQSNRTGAISGKIAGGSGL